MKVLATYCFIEFLFKLSIIKHGQCDLMLADICNYVYRFER